MKLKTLLEYLLHESVIVEYIEEIADYPKGFDIRQLKALPSLAAKKKYLSQYLPKLGEGSSRIVFKADENHALKVARNEKGIQQNSLEMKVSYEAKKKKFSDLVANVIDGDPEGALWLEAELARKVKAEDWKKTLGIGWNRMQGLILYPPSIDDTKAYSERYSEQAVKFAKRVAAFANAYNMPKGDLLRPSSWGVVNRKGKDYIVLIDYGLDWNIYNTHYN